MKRRPVHAADGDPAWTIHGPSHDGCHIFRLGRGLCSGRLVVRFHGRLSPALPALTLSIGLGAGLLRREGVAVDERIEEYEYGRFG